MAETIKRQFGRLPVFRGPWTSDIESSDVHKFNRYTYLGSEFISTVEGNALSPGEIVNGKLVEHEGWKVTANGTDPGLEAKANIETLANEAVQDVITNTNAAKDAALEAAEAANAAKDGIDAKIDNKANKDGYYGSMTVGSAENLVGRGSVEAEYVNRRTSAGIADIGSGSAAITRIKGRSVVWNQQVETAKKSFSVSAAGSNDNTIATNLIGSHKYLAVCNQTAVGSIVRNTFYISAPGQTSVYENAVNNYKISGGRRTWLFTNTLASYTSLHLWCNAPDVDVNYSNIQCIDLTLLGIDNLTTVEEVEAWLAENIGPLDYYAYTPGEVINNAAEGIKTRGFNLFNYATGKAYLPGKYSDYPYEYEICGTFTSISFTDVNGNTSVPELHEGRFFNVDAPGELTVVGGNNNDTLVHLVWSGWRNEGEPDYAYEPYWENTLNLGLTSLTGKLNGEGSSVIVFPHGLAKVGDVQDEIVGNRAIKRVGVVDLGTLDYALVYSNTYHIFTKNNAIPGSAPQKKGGISCLCARYTTSSWDKIASYATNNADKVVVLNDNSYGTNSLTIRDTAYTDAATFKTAVTGTLLYYELATPEEYILDNPPQFNYRVDDFSTEETVPSYDADNVIAPLAYDVQYAMNAVDVIRRLPDNYVERSNVKQTTGQSETDVLSQKAVDDNYAKKVGVEENLIVGAAKTLAGNQQVNGEFTTTVMSGADGVAKISEVKGKSLVWNQLLSVLSGKTKSGVTIISNGDGSYTISTEEGGATATVYLSWISKYVNGHKYLLRGCPKGGSLSTYLMVSGIYNIADSGNGVIFTVTSNLSGYWPRIQIASGGIITTPVVFHPQLTDLTLMFGEGNEPSTVEEFERLFPLPYYDYNEGEIISNKTEQVKVVGFNQWDEEWIVGGVDPTTGVPFPASNRFASKNYIPVLGGEEYYIKYGANTSLYFSLYDANKNFISGLSNYYNRTFVTPANARYIKFESGVIQGTVTYNHDICINISDPAKNGTYETYKHAELPLNLSTITGKLNGEGESVVIFPDGMRGTGTAYDYLIVDADGYARKAVKVMESVDLGTLTSWNKMTDGGSDANLTYFRSALSGRAIGSPMKLLCQKYANARGGSRWYLTDKTIGQYDSTEDKIAIADSTYASGTAADFKAAMSGVELVYELATPLTYVLDEPILCTFNAYHGGTLTQTPQAPDSAPMAMSVIYALDAVSELNGLPQNYVSKESLQAMLTAMQSAGLFSAYTMTFNATTGKYEFTFTANNS